jgi:hypothetical protein
MNTVLVVDSFVCKYFNGGPFRLQCMTVIAVATALSISL